MQRIRSLAMWSTLACLIVTPPIFAGPGGTYAPKGGSGTKPRTYGGGFGGAYGGGLHDEHDHYDNRGKPNYGPNNRPGGYRPSGSAIIQVRPTPNTVITVQPGYKPGSHFDRLPGGYRPAVVQKPIVTIQPNYNRPNSNKPGHGGNWDHSNNSYQHRPQQYHGGWYHGDWHGNWNNSFSRRPSSWGGWNSGKIQISAVAIGSPWRYGYWGYSNPYYTPTANVPAYINYSHPIITTASTDPRGQNNPYDFNQVTLDRAAQAFASARAAFFVGDYRAAQQEVDQALSLTPNDTVMHEFRALVMFATRQYRPASGAIYALLSSGPGWNWTTLIGLYPSVDVYTKQLRTLERFCQQNPQASEAHFLLGYHYLTAGHTNAAAEEYQQVLAVNPRDTLSAQLVTSLTGPARGAPLAQLQPVNPGQAVDPRFLIGNWSSSRNDGSSFNLSLGADRTYRWRYFAPGVRQPEEFSGTYTLADDILVLSQDGDPTMVGQVTPQANNRFNFKLTGGDQYDPGLDFSR